MGSRDDLPMWLRRGHRTEPPKTGTYYVEYDVPVSIDRKKKTGCIIMLIGYEE